MAAGKECTKCGVTKGPDEFYRSKKASDGLQWNCKECHRANVREYSRTIAGREARARYDKKARERRKRLKSALERIAALDAWMEVHDAREIAMAALEGEDADAR